MPKGSAASTSKPGYWPIETMGASEQELDLEPQTAKVPRDSLTHFFRSGSNFKLLPQYLVQKKSEKNS